MNSIRHAFGTSDSEVILCSSLTGCFVPTPVRSVLGRLWASVTGSTVATQYFCIMLWFRITESFAFKHSFPAPPPRLLFPVPSRFSSDVPSFGEPLLIAPSRPSHTLLSVPEARVTLCPAYMSISPMRPWFPSQAWNLGQGLTYSHCA